MTTETEGPYDARPTSPPPRITGGGGRDGKWKQASDGKWYAFYGDGVGPDTYFCIEHPYDNRFWRPSGVTLANDDYSLQDETVWACRHGYYAGETMSAAGAVPKCPAPEPCLRPSFAVTDEELNSAIESVTRLYEDLNARS